MSGLAQYPRIRGTISYKKFLTGDANTFATILLVNLFGVRLKPGKVPLKPLSLRLRFGEFRRVGYLFHFNFQFFEWHCAFSNSQSSGTRLFKRPFTITIIDELLAFLREPLAF